MRPADTPEARTVRLLRVGEQVRHTLSDILARGDVHDETLAIEGEFKFEVPQGAKPIWQEFAPARFRRSLRLGAAIDPAKVEAMYQNGVLVITMPKAEHAKPRQVQVQLGGNGKSN